MQINLAQEALGVLRVADLHLLRALLKEKQFHMLADEFHWSLEQRRSTTTERALFTRRRTVFLKWSLRLSGAGRRHFMREVKRLKGVSPVEPWLRW